MRHLKALLGVVVCCAAIQACTIRHPEKYFEKAYANKPYDAVIVPGTPYRTTGWDEATHARVVWAVYLHRIGVTRRIIMSGSAVYSPWVEAKVMREYAVALGVPRGDVLIEDRAEHSTENLFYGYRVAQHAGLTNVALASDGFQVKMLKSFNRRMKRRLGARIDLIPLVRDSVHHLFVLPSPVIDPSVAHVDTFVSIVDRQSWWYRLRGTLGKHVDWEER